MKIDSGAALFLADVMATLAASACAYYGFFRNNAYSALVAYLDRNYGGFGAFELVIPILFFALVAICCVFARGGTLLKIHTVFLILLLPSILSFSKVDWLSFLGASGDSTLFTTDLSFAAVLALGLLVIGGSMLVSFSSRIRHTKEEFLDRQAPQDDVEVVVRKELVFSSVLLLSCVAAVFGVGMTAFLLSTVLHPWVGSLGYPHMILALAATVVSAACLLLYLRSRGRPRMDGLDLPVSKQ